MSDLNASPVTADQPAAPSDGQFAPHWSTEAPRGGKTVLNRIIKEGATVPLFLGQTFIQSLRDLGYNHPTSAVCEHVDNAIQWGATEIRVYFHQTNERKSSKRGRPRAGSIDVLVWDNASGMAPHVLRASMSFGGSMCYDNRTSIGRYGVGMKTAALSMGPSLDVYSWQERGAIYNMMLDVKDIGNDKSNLVELPEPTMVDRLPEDICNILTSPMSYPKNADDQELFETDVERLPERLGRSGTVVFIPSCDRLTSKTAQPLVDHATKEMARVYRRYLDRGLRLFVNNRRVEAFDPTYWMENARHTRVEGLTEKRSRLYRKWELQIPLEEGSTFQETVTVRLFCLPIAAWNELPRKILKNDLKVFDYKGISFMRRDREVHFGTMSAITGKDHPISSWWRLEIDFPAALDEAFGVAVNKQGVRPKNDVIDLIKKAIKEDLTAVRRSIQQYWSETAAAAKETKAKLSEAERRANDADSLQSTVLPQPNPRTEEEAKALEANLRSLAIGLKREEESDEEAFQRVKNSRFITVFKHDEYWPFYHADFKFGKVILTINTAHPFFQKLYEPLSLLAKRASAINHADDETEAESDLAAGCSEAVVNLQLLLLSLARTQSEMTVNDESGDRQRSFELLRKQWSMNLATQLTSA